VIFVLQCAIERYLETAEYEGEDQEVEEEQAGLVAFHHVTPLTPIKRQMAMSSKFSVSYSTFLIDEVLQPLHDVIEIQSEGGDSPIDIDDFHLLFSTLLQCFTKSTPIILSPSTLDSSYLEQYLAFVKSIGM